MNVQLVINTLDFNLLINNENIRFKLEEIEFMKIKHVINYISLISCCLSLILLSSLFIFLFNIICFNLIMLNFILFLLYKDFVYKKLFQIELKILEKTYTFIINDLNVFFEFKYLYEIYNLKIEI